MIKTQKPPSVLKKWIIAARPWALPASTMPVLYGTSLSFVYGHSRFDAVRFILAFAAMVILHSAANMLSDVFDFKRGLDRDVTPVSGALVRGWLTARQVAAGSVVLFALGMGIGILLLGLTGLRLLAYVGGAGIVIGAGYSFLKKRAFGDLAVFLNFGILGSLGAWLVQNPHFSWLPVVWTVPMALLVSAILHANNWRDSISDKEKRVTTVASLLGDRGSFVYYGFLIFMPFVLVLVMTFIPRIQSPIKTAMPLTTVIVLAGLPYAVVLWKRGLRRRNPVRPLDFIVLDGATSLLNLFFGLAMTASIWLQYFLTTVFDWVY